MPDSEPLPGPDLAKNGVALTDVPDVTNGVRSVKV
jgi:hypothetical protein